jgi:phosphatidylglycerol---prolipoprotein diacylglyceryl transferase
MLPFINIGQITISTYILVWFAYSLIAIKLFRKELLKCSIEKYHANWLASVVAISGITGAKIYGMIEFFVVHPRSGFETVMKESGFGSYGLLLCGLGILMIFLRMAKFPVFRILDGSVWIMILGVMMGRCACLLSGDGCYGLPTDLPWGMAFPEGVKPTLIKVHPTPLYEIIALVPVALFFWKVSFEKKQTGVRFFYFLFMISIARFFIDFSRSTTEEKIQGMTIEQIVASILMLCTGSFLLFMFLQKNNKHTINFYFQSTHQGGIT